MSFHLIDIEKRNSFPVVKNIPNPNIDGQNVNHFMSDKSFSTKKVAHIFHTPINTQIIILHLS